MNKKIFALLIAACVSTAPMYAEQHSDLNVKAYAQGLTDGIVTTLAASTAVYGFYLMAAAENALYLPKYILKQIDTKTVLKASHGSFHKNTNNFTLNHQYETVPVYKECANKLYQMIQDPSTIISNNGIQTSPSVYKDTSSLQVISKQTHIYGGAFLIAGAALALYLYYRNTDNFKTNPA